MPAAYYVEKLLEAVPYKNGCKATFLPSQKNPRK